MDSDVAQANTDYYLLCHIARLVNEGFFYDGGKIRGLQEKWAVENISRQYRLNR